MKRLRAALPLLVLIAIGLALLASGALDRLRPQHLASQQEYLKDQLAIYPLLAGLGYIALTTLAVATGIPGAIVVILAGGMLFGVFVGTLLSAIGLTLGALILFLAARSAFAHGTGTAPLLVERLRAGFHAYPFSYTMFLRLVPFFPFGAVTVALAWLRCPMWLFLVTSIAGGTVMLIFETALGAGLANTIAQQGAISLHLFSERRVMFPLLGMAVLALVPIVLGQLRRRSRSGKG
ncbi:MAG TPA: VTT domain-containing protein [Rhodanobacteraceae bacterium]|nr:VTT domain-containing protein [Rhodanobacteraceae bacterium]